MNVKEINEEVLYSKGSLTCINSGDIDSLKHRAKRNGKKKIRICCHQSVASPLHEMLIVHAKGSYVRPHRHIRKYESIHLIEGLLEVVLFDHDGQINRVIQMGERSTGLVFYYKLSAPVYHTVIPVSDVVVFHETTDGPFRLEETVYADWAPAYDVPEAGQRYISEVKRINSENRQ